MKNNILYYEVGALLYCPANKKTISDSIINEKFGKNFSLALCLEDTINDYFIEEAEQILISSINKIFYKYQSNSFYLPKIFIRVRNPEQIYRLTKLLGKSIEIITGFIIPKFSLNNAQLYINEIIRVNEMLLKEIYVMPIYETVSIIDPRKRIDTMYSLKEYLSKVEKYVLNIRVGGNDLCNIFGIRRNANESIHRINPISNILSDIMTVYGSDYVISAPVWEYYSGKYWEQGLIEEIKDDKLCGFIGKTAIHPKQIPIINKSYKVTKNDFNDAKAILNWNKQSNNFISSNQSRERMNEYNTHINWAKKVIYRAKVFGIEV